MAHDAYGIYVAKQRIELEEAMRAIRGIMKAPKTGEPVKIAALEVLRASLSRPVTITFSGNTITMRSPTAKRTRSRRKK